MNTVNLEISKLHPFEGHPYLVQDNEEMEALTDSIQEQGVISPIIVRPLESGNYEIISGHRRCHAAQKAGLETVPAMITPMSREEAIVAVVDSNLHREHLLPSEKAFAYKMKADAMKHQGKRRKAQEEVWNVAAYFTSGQNVPKSDESRTATEIGEQSGESYKTVQRYIRLTYLIPELLKMVDGGKIAFTPAVHLSYLTQEEQNWVQYAMAEADSTPSVAQAFHLKEQSQAGTLTPESVSEILGQPKANQKERLRIPMDRIRQYFPKGYTNAQMEETIVKLCEGYHRRRMSQER